MSLINAAEIWIEGTGANDDRASYANYFARIWGDGNREDAIATLDNYAAYLRIQDAVQIEREILELAGFTMVGANLLAAA